MLCNLCNMAAFIEDLWNSIFTPGPTPTLLVATNASFGALQVVLLSLLIATHSIHFVILSIICGGLWWAINWFAAELLAFNKQEEESRQAQKDKTELEGSEAAVDDEITNVEISSEKSPAEPAAISSSIDADDARPRLVSSSSSGNISADSDWERIDQVAK